MRLLQTLIFGLGTGSFLIVATLGFALTSRVQKFLNIAHAEVISAAAFTTFYLEVRLGWNLLLASAVAIVVGAVLALLVARLVYDPMRSSGPTVLLIVSVGATYLIHGVTEGVVRPGIYSLSLPWSRDLVFGSLRVGPGDLVTMGVAIASVAGLHAILTRTRMGLSVRALASDEALASSRGIDVPRASRTVWLMTGAFAGMAGVLLGVRGALNTDIAFDQILLIVSVSILAGLGSIYGVVASGLVLGIAMDMSTLVIPTGYRTAVAFAAVILALIFRPEGLSGSRLARREA